MPYRILVGGPKNSGKSTLLLSLVAGFRAMATKAESIELDVWSNSYAAFQGKVSFKDRPKRFGLDWDYMTPLEERYAAFNASTADIVFGDLPGVLDKIVDLSCTSLNIDSTMVVSNSTEGLQEWTDRFTANGFPPILRCLTFKDEAPMIAVSLDRVIDPHNPSLSAIEQRIRKLMRGSEP